MSELHAAEVISLNVIAVVVVHALPVPIETVSAAFAVAV